MQDIISIASPELLSVFDKAVNHRSFGGNQDWFPTKWQRDSGCGPTAAATMLSYFSLRRKCERICPKIVNGAQPINREDMADFMNTVWNYVTPGTMGVHRTAQFIGGVSDFMQSLGYGIRAKELVFPRMATKRCCQEQAAEFICSGLENDMPVAFLNYSNGMCDNMSSWHWVSITALEKRGEQLLVTISDEGEMKTIDFGLWMSTSRLGGALVYFLPDIP